ncbi:hypothetical protein GCK72_008449 [Caenorhabditis remanei]|uniref:Uncharacterized protein n=1 Tax=Caenorhabditis remanei TaxID=31234 RepID=A0A6A5H0N4_CAERE|nr:hypothetical protein GCK72_008449 [Caenorhabditis remanei]KAF1760203.1 hypothetical protein GCK72_008449 [Caenorhabditis remanei]
MIILSQIPEIPLTFSSSTVIKICRITRHANSRVIGRIRLSSVPTARIIDERASNSRESRPEDVGRDSDDVGTGSSSAADWKRERDVSSGWKWRRE